MIVLPVALYIIVELVPFKRGYLTHAPIGTHTISKVSANVKGRG